MIRIPFRLQSKPIDSGDVTMWSSDGTETIHPHIMATTESQSQWYSIQAEAGGDVVEVMIYDYIGRGGVDAAEFVKDFRAIKAKSITLRVNSPGGSVFDGMAIYNVVKDRSSEVTAIVDGLAASIASVIVMAAGRVTMSPASFLMIHQPWGAIVGNARELRELADLLDKTSGLIVDIYAAKTGKTKDEILALMDAETWYSGADAVDAGFADALTGQSEEKSEEQPAARTDTTVENTSAQPDQQAAAADLERYKNLFRQAKAKLQRDNFENLR